MSSMMSFLRDPVPVNRTLVSVILLLTLPLLLDLTQLPDSLAAQEYIFSLLTPCDGLGLCSVCGEVLEMVDLVQRRLVNPFRDRLTLSSADWDLQTLQSYQRCLREPLLRGCETLVHRVRTKQTEFARRILEQVAGDRRFRQKWGSFGENYVVRNAAQLTRYILQAQERSLAGMHDMRKEEGAAQSIIYEPSTLSLAGDPEIESLVTRVWFLRRDVSLLHHDFCYPFCEGKLSVTGRIRLALARFYVRNAVKARLILLRQHHRGTIVVAELIMIGFAFCVERLMRPGLSGGGTAARRITRLRGGTARSRSFSSGFVSGAHGGEGAAAGSSGGGGGGSGKYHCRPGRRRRWVVVV
ncbi:hypothetical protein GH5_00546 [Leishmania sp. Ghana 2012 LV757]|uniref:hypothetical protein n=1 Tax=Leishmania sp. Ghana 2012 LV757 TaxID=2803181 RepID=UPI001B592830|nr:hypothetical protein GH5_00546 [Leishmania sp. Ghana 2012 LV757]